MLADVCFAPHLHLIVFPLTLYFNHRGPKDEGSSRPQSLLKGYMTQRSKVPLKTIFTLKMFWLVWGRTRGLIIHVWPSVYQEDKKKKKLKRNKQTLIVGPYRGPQLRSINALVYSHPLNYFHIKVSDTHIDSHLIFTDFTTSAAAWWKQTGKLLGAVGLFWGKEWLNASQSAACRFTAGLFKGRISWSLHSISTHHMWRVVQSALH